MAVGTATDQAGNTYTWLVRQPVPGDEHARLTPSSFRGVFVDEFTLGGDGPEQLHNGFVADITFVGSLDAPFDIRAPTSFGDPVEFGPECRAPPV